MDRFAACAETVMTRRGAFLADDPVVDGPSAHGIGLGLYSAWIGGPADATALRGLPRSEAARILRAMVWSPLGAGQLPPGPDLALLAFALEAGTIRALAELQRILGVAPSGAPDAATGAAARAASPVALAQAITRAHAAWRDARHLPGPAAPPTPRRRVPRAISDRMEPSGRISCSITY